jgi:hypothetical protein
LKKGEKRRCAPYSVNLAWVASKPIGKAFRRRDKAEVGEARNQIKKEKKKKEGAEGKTGP